jgi:hypothetical protein
MKKFQKMKGFGVLGMVLFVLAMVFGGSVAMAAAITDPDPNNPLLNTNSPDTRNLDTERGGKGATATHTNESDIAAREIDKNMVEIMPYGAPELLIKVHLKNTHQVSKYNIEYVTAGATPLDFTFDYETTYSNAGYGTWGVHNGTASNGYQISLDAFRALSETTTFMLSGIMGYQKPEDTTGYGSGDFGEDDGDAVFVVTSRNETDYTIRVEPVNGWKNVGGTWTNVMPGTIPAGTEIHEMSTACSESQWEVAPENWLPVTKKVQLQKQVVNIVYTDDFLQQMKEVEFGVDDLTRRAIYNMNRKGARTFWLGAGSKRRVNPGKNMGSEDAYTTVGVLRQALNKMVCDGDIDWDFLNHICDIQFGVNSLTDRSVVFMGHKFTLKLMKLLTSNTQTEITQLDNMDGTIELKFNSYKLNPMGSLMFIHTKTLDDIGYGDCAFVMDVDNATRYVKFDMQNSDVDMKQGGGPSGETRQAKRLIWIMADAVSLHGTNSILIGPSKKIFGAYSENEMDDDILIFNAAVKTAASDGLDPDTTNTDSAFYASSSAAALAPFKAKVDSAGNVMDGTRVYLDTDDPKTGYSEGHTLIWSNAKQDWELYSGPFTITGNEA